MSPSAIASTQFSTQQFNVWRDSIEVVFDVETAPESAGRSFAADVEAFQLGDMVIANAALGEQRYVRSPARARRDGMDHFVLNLYRSGGWKAQTERGEFEGYAGQVSVLDLASDLVSDEPDSQLVTLFLPRSLIEDRLPNLSELHGRAPTGPHAVLLAEFLDLLARRLPIIPAGQERALNRATCEMLIACLTPTLANLEPARPSLELVLHRRARRFIETHIGSAKLTVDSICNAVGVSRRTLYRLFDTEGGVQRYIQTRRLERIRQILSDPKETRRIAEIAAQFGFVRSDHFARAFKQQFGQSARALREHPPNLQQAASEAVSNAQSNDYRFDSWIRALNG
ncbi:MAG: helix-turn-helix domain-containing protein [Chelatococcus sp.]|uniref:helix-turn-helix domain-containing protein n=1 Tax=Chelatococcus sp. TaxID=1953771 RepID=UPI0025BE0C5B|nr:helix-turn-helix domain-containing protein [Chelatococcus sp.]MBX3536676.1 helix-turn-helix domain-containing protein [Chelatococcus sp.]